MARDLHRSTTSKRKRKKEESKNENNWSADHIERNKKERKVLDYFMPHCQSTCAHDLDYFGMENGVELHMQSQTRIIMERKWRKRREKWRKCCLLFGFVMCVTACRIEPSCDGDSFNSFNSSDYETTRLWR